MEQMIEIPDYILKPQEIEGFTDKWTEILSFYRSQTDDFEAVERMHELYFKRRKYSDFDIFLTVMSRHYNRIKADAR
jgi:hypothetical protein